MDITDITGIINITDTMVIMDIIDTVSTCLQDRTNLKVSRAYQNVFLYFFLEVQVVAIM